ncbi:DHH family phosphoesterase [Protofrankia symbiont of Coriaria ruscifolia]|uniref:Phosphoesterase RecJ domain-containing protein n=1 Tax=Candidatus Protofrankia californiensis TaxID=1839754 RepID=A0A1C3PCJ9_9ACTN|nr:bifunctional oligoribonuclease/PAP phosphatase NrnA [Protofrankia symbiont of Coriaria ruscifolia]SBW27555.1 phosphoesterase RecJ domain-containing protein [Candidatus Protofrankia californiensis]
MTDVTSLADLSLLPVPGAGEGTARAGAASDEVVGEQRDRAVEAILSAVRDGESVLLVAHVDPDGDSLGSAIALGLALRTLGTRASVSFDSDPFVVPRSLTFLPGQDLLVPPSLVPATPDLVVTLDAGSLARLGALGRVATRARRMVVIDHHASNTRFGDVNLIDADAASTSVMVTDVIDALGVELDHDLAVAIYTGLVTDTGSFRYGATTPEVHRLAARLLATGIRHDLITRTVWDTHRFSYLRLLGELLGRARLEPEHDLVWTWCAFADLTGAGLTLDEIEGVIDIVRTTAEAEVAVVCKQDADQIWRVSVRSKGGVDVGAVCTQLGGGGHRFAAGLSSSDSLEQTMDTLREALVRAPRLPA